MKSIPRIKILMKTLKIIGILKDINFKADAKKYGYR